MVLTHSDINKRATVSVLSFPLWDLWCTLGLRWRWNLTGSIYCLWIARDCAGVLNIVSTAPAHPPLPRSPLQRSCCCAFCGGNFQAGPVCVYVFLHRRDPFPKKGLWCLQIFWVRERSFYQQKKERSKSRNQRQRVRVGARERQRERGSRGADQ